MPSQLIATVQDIVPGRYAFNREQMSSPRSVWRTYFFGPTAIEQVVPGTHDHDCKFANDIGISTAIGSFVSVRKILMPLELTPRNTW